MRLPLIIPCPRGDCVTKVLLNVSTLIIARPGRITDARSLQPIYLRIAGLKDRISKSDLMLHEQCNSNASAGAGTFGNDAGPCCFRPHRSNDDAARPNASRVFCALGALRFASCLSVHRSVRNLDSWGGGLERAGSSLRLSLNSGVWPWVHGCGRRGASPSELDRRPGFSLHLWSWFGPHHSNRES